MQLIAVISVLSYFKGLLNVKSILSERSCTSQSGRVVKIQGKAPRRSVSGEGSRKVVTLYEKEIYQSDVKVGAFLRALLKCLW